MTHRNRSIHINPQGICSIEGEVYPAIGYGTFPLKGEPCFLAVKQAIACGYRILDTATFYQNLSPISRAIS